MQGFAYAMLILLARRDTASHTRSSAENREESINPLPSVTGATYLLVASTAHDLHAGFSLFVRGENACHRAFGFVLLVVYGVMASAAMTVLVSTSDNSASVVLNAVTVLFIADLDEKSLKFLVNVPRTWRLFWAVESIGMSFTVALIAIAYIGDLSPLIGEDVYYYQNVPPALLWGIIPVAVTLCAYISSSTMNAACNAFTDAWKSIDEPTAYGIAMQALAGIFSTVGLVQERLGAEPFFYFVSTMWVAHVGVTLYHISDYWRLVAFYINGDSADAEKRLEITKNKFDVVLMNMVLAIGIFLKLMGALGLRYQRVIAIPQPRQPLGANAPGVHFNDYGISGGSSVMVGWGIGYWVLSLMYVVACSLPDGGCGWTDAPTIFPIIGYVGAPFFFVSCIFMVCDTDFLGTRFGEFVKPVVDKMRNRRKVEYWILATVFRDFLFVFAVVCVGLWMVLQNYNF